ncbi:hypothetical protein TWF694_005272 [Orbilia ellipsospora]|uniref:NACHT-NTPase and P-loop NTPases N-terminal domain-containing protein n=1 Tax=Orbilia ellipsospora TaxID=2528407 RepID=A0AAV9WSM4_9PEZI
MASPVSIGDVFLLAKLAYTLGRSFTTGRKSAPAEFQEVESQLYSISTALSALDHACKNGRLALGINNTGIPPSLRDARGNTVDDALVSMLQGCQDMLKHLEALVSKYTLVSEPHPGTPQRTKWTGELKKNWRKIMWTKEGGDLAVLRRSLSIHINSLNLALGVINHTQNDRVENQVNRVTLMLTEIHAWFAANIQNNISGVSASMSSIQIASLADTPLARIHFELWEESPNGLECLCPSASVHPKWNERRPGQEGVYGDTQQPLFECHCAFQSGQGIPHPFRISDIGYGPQIVDLQE